MPSDADPDAAEGPLTPPTVAETAAGRAALQAPFAGYLPLDLLGSGGMGEVILVEDVKLGRQVALKRMRSAAPTDAAIARFLREAKIQARLDHPSIVPIHDIGRDSEGLPYFTMKRITGVTLASRIAGNDGERTKLVHLLRAFVDVCRAIELAHARGVIHRDLKPSNIMLGDYGEVYVIDWGVAHVAGEAEIARTGDPGGGFTTRAGAVLGTRGYSSPEQMRGEVVTASTDVYALGAILFEILSGERFDPFGLGMADRSAAERAPARAVPPELDAVCARALMEAAADRPTAHELAHHVQLYIDGDRDLELRRAIASTHLRAARAHLTAAEESSRARAMSEAGRALALTPESREASDLVGHLLLTPPRTLPRELERRIDERATAEGVRHSWLASNALLAYVLLVPIAMATNTASWRTAGAFTALALSLVLLARYNARRDLSLIQWSVIGNAGIVAICSRFFGPFVVVPGLAAAITIMFMVFPPRGNRPIRVLLPMLAGFVLPIVLEKLGWIASTWSFDHGALVSHPDALYFEGAGSLAFLIVVNLALIVVVGVLARNFGLAQRAARRQLEIWAWHVEQLLPSEHRQQASVSPSPASSAA